jgi:sensor histidine kinase YesM
MSLSERLFDYHKKNRAVSHIIFWIVLLLVQISSSSYFNADQVSFKNNLVGDGTNLLAQLPAAYFLAYFIVPRFFLKQRYAAAFIYFIIGSYLICLLSRLEVIFIEEPFYGRGPNPNETITEIITNVAKLAYVYFFRIFSVAFVFTFIKLLKDQLAIQQRSLSLEKEKAETELKMLKAQLNPHFLFNTLNNIYSLSLNDSPVTSAAIGRLAEILDYILYQCNSVYVPVSAEVTLLNNYIDLEKLRYDERLIVNFTSNVENNIKIAPLILLSLVENAFKHGAANETGTPVINIELTARESHFNFLVYNSFTPLPEKKKSNSIGLLNLRHQLELIYPGKHNLMITQDELFYKVNFNIDLQ